MPGSHSKCSSLIYPNLINWCIYHGPIPILFKASSQWLFPEFWKGCYTISVSCLMLILTLVGLSPWRGCGHLLSLPILNTHYRTEYAAAAAKLLQLCPTLCDPIDGTPPGSSVPGILQARILEWVAISFSNAGMHAKLLQSCPTLCDPMDSSPPSSSVHRILKARILEWVAISFWV